MWQQLCCVVLGRNKVVANFGGNNNFARRHSTTQSGDIFLARTVQKNMWTELKTYFENFVKKR